MFDLRKFGPFFDGDGGSGGGEGGTQGTEDGERGKTKKQEGEMLTYDKWLANQPEEVQNLIGDHTNSLKSALDDERESRKKFETQLRDLAKKAEDGSEAQKRLEAMADQAAEADLKATFYEDAHKAGVSNLKLAYMVAKQDDLFDKRGNVNFEQLKKDYPELFGGGSKVPGNAGNGTDDDDDKPRGGMNAFIRKATGRGGNQ